MIECETQCTWMVLHQCYTAPTPEYKRKAMWGKEYRTDNYKRDKKSASQFPNHYEWIDSESGNRRLKSGQKWKFLILG